MAQPIDPEPLLSAWRALSEQAEGAGWRTIQVGSFGPIRTLAGRHFPGNQEALLALFPSAHLPAPNALPSGRGFAVSRTSFDGPNAACRWICLSREEGGDLSLFTAMAEDVLGVLRSLEGTKESVVLASFLERISAWQKFMEKDRGGILSREAEVGLFGELLVLRDLLAAGLDPADLVDAWQGPLDGLHDFVLGRGAVEVKTTLSPAGGVAMIGSLEQMDESLVCPLFLAEVRILLQEGGETLPRLAETLRETLKGDPLAAERLGSRLLKAGLLDTKAQGYERSFRKNGIRFIQVQDGFPRLTRASVPSGIRSARYEIDLDRLPESDVSLPTLLELLGV